MLKDRLKKRASPNVILKIVETEETKWGGAAACIYITERSSFLSCKWEMPLFFKSTAYQSPVFESFYNLPQEISSKKKGPVMKEAVMSHRTVFFNLWRGFSMNAWQFCFLHVRHFCVLCFHVVKCKVHLFIKHLKVSPHHSLFHGNSFREFFTFYKITEL